MCTSSTIQIDEVPLYEAAPITVSGQKDMISITGEGWLYLCVIIDLFNREVIAQQTSRYIDRRLVCSTLKNALLRRHFPKNVLLHSDRGSQYNSADFKRLLLQYGIKQSMSRAGNCWDNAVAESFFHTLKIHIIHDCYYKTREDANKALFEGNRPIFNGSST